MIHAVPLENKSFAVVKIFLADQLYKKLEQKRCFLAVSNFKPIEF